MMSNTIGSQFPDAFPKLAQIGVSRTDKQSGFGDELKAAIEQVDKVQDEADFQVGNLLQENEQDVHSTMIAVEKAELSFQLMMQMRNKVVNAYQEIARMQF